MNTIYMEIGKVMVPRTQLVSCNHMDTVETAIDMMAEADVSSIVVTKDEEIIGIVTSTDVLKILKEKREKGFSLTVESIMSRDLVTVEATEHLNVAIEKMADIKTHHLFVSHKGRYIGIISSLDIVREKSLDIKSFPWARGAV